MKLFQILMFPASEGDCLLIEYGDPAAPERILIDGGRKATYQNHLSRYLHALPRAQQRLRLFVVTHIDRDHIEGALALLRDDGLGLRVDDFWFNSYEHLLSDAPRPTLSAMDAENLTFLARTRGWTQNKEFASGAVSTGAPPRLRDVTLCGGMVLTLLGPDRAGLERLRPSWEAECRKAGIKPGGAGEGQQGPPRPTLSGTDVPEPEALAAMRTPSDTSRPNGTSIAFLLTYAGRRVLCSADARPTTLRQSLALLGATSATPLQLDAVKVPHHASKRNVTQALLACIRSPRFLISTNGMVTGHPDPEGVARIVTAAGPARTLFFNYRNSRTRLWDRDDWKRRLGYGTEYGDGQQPLVITL